jgi:hypothetical protein
MAKLQKRQRKSDLGSRNNLQDGSAVLSGKQHRIGSARLSDEPTQNAPDRRSKSWRNWFRPRRSVTDSDKLFGCRGKSPPATEASTYAQKASDSDVRK